MSFVSWLVRSVENKIGSGSRISAAKQQVHAPATTKIVPYAAVEEKQQPQENILDMLPAHLTPDEVAFLKRPRDDHPCASDLRLPRALYKWLSERTTPTQCEQFIYRLSVIKAFVQVEVDSSSPLQFTCTEDNVTPTSMLMQLGPFPGVLRLETVIVVRALLQNTMRAMPSLTWSTCVMPGFHIGFLLSFLSPPPPHTQE